MLCSGHVHRRWNPCAVMFCRGSDELWRRKHFVDGIWCNANFKKFVVCCYAVNFLQHFASSVIYFFWMCWLIISKKVCQVFSQTYRKILLSYARLWKVKTRWNLFQQKWAPHFFYDTSRVQVRSDNISLAYGGGRVVIESGSETSISTSTHASVNMYDSCTSILKKKTFLFLFSHACSSTTKVSESCSIADKRIKQIFVV